MQHHIPQSQHRILRQQILSFFQNLSPASCEQRLSEAARMGIQHAIIPYANLEKLHIPAGMQVTSVKNINQAIGVALSTKEGKSAT